ncbi:MAG: hypothetical protein ABEJ91_03150, partial [Candidatus Nanohaloarchaea archaeon]
MDIKEEEMAYPVEALEALRERDEDEMTHEQKIALETLERHCKVRDLDTLKELHDELSGIDSLKDVHIYKLLEVVPQHESTVRSIFSKERVKLEDSEVE